MITEIIDACIAEKRAEGNRPPTKFRVSDAGRCHLMRYWKRQGRPYTDTPDERTYRVFEAGHIFHRWLQDVLKKKGVLVASEMKVEDEHRIGHIDAIVSTEKGLVLYDFKTIHSQKFRYDYTEDTHYILQALTYYTMITPSSQIEDVRLAYISKDDLRILDISVLGAMTKREVEEDWEAVIEAWNRKKEPEPNPMDWECRYCVYQSDCKAERRPNEGV